ncbi:MAG: UDP-glucose 4-epimerase GalE [Cyclobacteriaceae bacterium]|nr:UDP-glucose 4-epimerase GalE [Cyclobacteriaceae bacterium]
MKKILLTGGTGYIGSHTAVELIREGFEVVIADDLSNSNIDVLDNIQEISGTRPSFVRLDLRDKKGCQALFAQHAPEAIIHFAAKKAVGESVHQPLLYYDVNLNSLLNLLEQSEKYPVKGIVFSSSCTVYGQPEILPVTELTPFQAAESPYGNTKQICEEILHDNCRSNPNLNAISLRYFNPAGAHPSALIGELPLGVPANLVPFITQTAAGIREELKVFGDDYPTPDGTAIRDYIHVVDLALAHVVAVKRLLENKQKNNYEFFNIGTGKGYSVLEVIRAFEKASGQTLAYRVVERRAGDIVQIYADTSFANSELGWKAERGLEEMMDSAWKWQLKLKK